MFIHRFLYICSCFLSVLEHNINYNLFLKKKKMLRRHEKNNLITSKKSKYSITKLCSGTYVARTAFSVNGKYFALGSVSGHIQIWDAVTCQKLHLIKASTETVSCLSFSVDGKYIAFGSDDGYIHVLDAITFKELFFMDEAQIDDKWNLKYSALSFNRLSFSPDGKYLATQINGKRIRMRDAITFQDICSFQHYGVSHFSFSPNGNFLTAGGLSVVQYKMMCEFDLQSFQQKFVKSESNIFKNSESIDIVKFQFSGNGKYLAIVTSNNYVQFHDATTYEFLFFIKTHASCMAFSQDNKYFAIVYGYDVLVIYDTETFREKEIIDLPARCNPYCITFSMNDKYLIVNTRKNCYMVDLCFL